MAPDVSAVVPPTPMNRTMRALQLHPVNTEGNLSAPNAPTRRANVVDVRATASSAGVSDATMQLAESLRRANPSITVDQARMYTRPNPPMGPVRELWHVAHPINAEIPIPTGC